jgi:hypothetical protein
MDIDRLGDSWVFLRAGVFFADRKEERLPHTLESRVWLGGVGAAWSFASRWTVRAQHQRPGEVDATFLDAGAHMERMALSRPVALG